MGWAHAEGILDRHPLDGMRGPPQPSPRMHVPVEQVVALLAHAQRVLEDHVGFGDRSHRSVIARHRAEQVLLLTRLAADSGARRGELAALQIGDLNGAVLTIARAASGEVIGSTKPAGRVG
jgi:integrase